MKSWLSKATSYFHNKYHSLKNIGMLISFVRNIALCFHRNTPSPARKFQGAFLANRWNDILQVRARREKRQVWFDNSHLMSHLHQFYYKKTKWCCARHHMLRIWETQPIPGYLAVRDQPDNLNYCFLLRLMSWFRQCKGNQIPVVSGARRSYFHFLLRVNKVQLSFGTVLVSVSQSLHANDLERN